MPGRAQLLLGNLELEGSEVGGSKHLNPSTHRLTYPPTDLPIHPPTLVCVCVCARARARVCRCVCVCWVVRVDTTG